MGRVCCLAWLSLSWWSSPGYSRIQLTAHEASVRTIRAGAYILLYSLLSHSSVFSESAMYLACARPLSQPGRCVVLSVRRGAWQFQNVRELPRCSTIRICMISTALLLISLCEVASCWYVSARSRADHRLASGTCVTSATQTITSCRLIAILTFTLKFLEPSQMSATASVQRAGTSGPGTDPQLPQQCSNRCHC